MNDIETLHKRADEHLDMGNTSAALQVYKDILTIKSSDAYANYMTGVILAEKGDSDSAIDFISEAIKLDPNDADAYFILAKIYQSKEKYITSIENCHKAVELDADFDDAWILLCSLYAYKKDNEAAYPACKRALELSPDNLQANYDFANSALALKKLNEAEDYFRKAILIDSTVIEARIGLVLSLKAANKIDMALDEAMTASKLCPNNADVLCALAEVNLCIENYEKAKQLYSDALLINPENGLALNNLGIIHQEQRQYSNAIEHYKKALNLSPNNTDILQNIGCCYYELKNNKSAIDYFRQALKLNSNLSLTKHMLAMAEGNSEIGDNNEYVTELFDVYAKNYDEKQGILKYKVPEYINNTIRILANKNKLSKFSALDIGCGTGLCGKLIQDVCQSISGVDLSEEMLIKANDLGIYDELVSEDMSDYMQNNPDSFDLILSADVLVYLGSLDHVLKTAHIALKDKGYLVFSVQVDDSLEKYELTNTGRYNHSRAYIQSLALDGLFQEVYEQDIISRTDYGIPVNSRIHVFQVFK